MLGLERWRRDEGHSLLWPPASTSCSSQTPAVSSRESVAVFRFPPLHTHDHTCAHTYIHKYKDFFLSVVTRVLARKWEGREEAWTPQCLSGHTMSLKSLIRLIRCTTKDAYHLPVTQSQGPNLQSLGLWRTFQIHTRSTL